MQIVGVCGRKGGSGKTTVAIHFAAECVGRGLEVVLIDCDVQGSATYWADPGKLPMPVRHMPLESGRGLDKWSREIRAIKADLIVLDSPPHLNEALGGVIGLCDIALLPCGPSGLDLIATGETVGLIREIRAKRDDGKPQIILVPNRTDQRTASGRELSQALAAMGEQVAPEVRQRTAFCDAFNAGEWVGGYAPGSPAHAEMRKLADFVLKHMGATRDDTKGRIKRKERLCTSGHAGG